MSAFTQFKSYISIFIGLCTVLIGIFITEYVVALDEARNIQFRRANMVEQLATVRARLEGELNSTLHLTRGLVAYVSTHPETTELEFDRIAADTISIGKHIRNIGLAPDNRISLVYPITGNERAIGLHYKDLPDQWPAVERAIKLGSTVVAGPVNLVQGGQAIIARTPVFIRSEFGADSPNQNYWGLISIVINAESLFQATGIAKLGSALNLAIRGTDALGKQGAIFYGDPSVFLKDPVLQEVSLPNGSWELAAEPNGGWNLTTPLESWRRILGIMTSLVIGVLVTLLMRSHVSARHLSLHDQLTGLPNRRLLDDRLNQLSAHCDRNGGTFSLLYLDLNGFKQVNDDHGHYIGDLVLQEIGHRLNHLVRKGDTVSRIGGDEFLVVLPDTNENAAVQAVLDKIREAIRLPIRVAGQTFTMDVAIGAACYPDDAIELQRLVAIADRRMYASKRRSTVTTLYRA